MKLKCFSLLAATAICLGFSSCSSEEPGINNGGTTDSGERLHAKIQLYLPTGTRSKTEDYNDPTNSSDGYEIGKTYENNVNNVIVALATYDSDTKKFTPVAVSATSATPADDFNESSPVYRLNFRQDEIQKAAEKRVYIFAFCNAEGLINVDQDFSTSDFVDKIMTITSIDNNQGPWKNGNFLMANAPNKAIPYKNLPTETELKRNYTTPEKALDLGAVDVARVVSRFDFKQTNDNTYPVYDVNLEDKDRVPENAMASVKFLSMAPITIAKEYYLLPRVSDDGTDANWDLCGTETRNNWVVSPNFATKTTQFGNEFLNKYLAQSMFTPYDDTSFYKYTDLASFNGEDDNDENWGDKLPEGSKLGYKIWRYVTENTLPAVAAQKKGISTGVLFKAEIVNPKAGSTLATAMATKNDIYSFNGVMYGDIVALRKMASQLDDTNTLRQAFVKVFGAEYLETETTPEGKTIFKVADENLKNCDSEANNNTFKIYRATLDGQKNAHYYVYYLYRNRHNDNGNPAAMGAMEFGTVRNNIYKLAVTSVSEFGHPSDPKDDPDPEDPHDPDEDPKTYLKVSVRVVPWMVRVNNIEF